MAGRGGAVGLRVTAAGVGVGGQARQEDVSSPVPQQPAPLPVASSPVPQAMISPVLGTEGILSPTLRGSLPPISGVRNAAGLSPPPLLTGGVPALSRQGSLSLKQLGEEQQRARLGEQSPGVKEGEKEQSPEVIDLPQRAKARLESSLE